jgi:uncharacterized protein with HEPN domain
VNPSTLPELCLMQREVRKYLFDIRQAAEELLSFTAEKTREDYLDNALLQAAVERKFEIIGEATAQLAKLDEKLAAEIPGYRHLIAFRNILIHGYADVDD